MRPKVCPESPSIVITKQTASRGHLVGEWLGRYDPAGRMALLIEAGGKHGSAAATRFAWGSRDLPRGLRRLSWAEWRGRAAVDRRVRSARLIPAFQQMQRVDA